MARDPAVGPVTKYQPDGKSFIQQATTDKDPGGNGKGMPEPQSLQTSEIIGKIPVVILAGGKGTRLQEETKGLLPKPMIEVNGKPLLEHIISIYIGQGSKEIYVATGFMAKYIHRWWTMNKQRYDDLGVEVLPVVTGLETQTGGRVLFLQEHLMGRTFMMTYGDGLSNINLLALIDHHRRNDAPVTLTAAHPPARFGNLVMNGDMVSEFGEKTQLPNDWINSGFYVIEQEAVDLVNGPACQWEYDVLPSLALQGRLAAYKHPGFFQMIDTPRDLRKVERMCERHETPWLKYGVF